MTKKLSVQDLCFIGISVALIAAAAQFSIPLPGGVPFTLQTLAVPLLAIILGAKRGCITALVYLLLGAIGAPVFAGAIIGIPSGAHRLIGPWGGFLLSYPFMMLAIGWGAESENKAELAICLVIGSLTNLLMGTLQHSFYHAGGLAASFAVAFAPFAPLEAVKLFLAFIAGPQIRKAVAKIRRKS